MTNTLFWALPLLVPAGALWLNASAKYRHQYWRVLLCFAGILAIYGFATIGVNPNRETSGIMPIVVGLLPPLITGSALRGLEDAKMWVSARWVIGAIVYFVSTIGSMFLGHYILPLVIPGPLGCCPL